MRPFLTLAFLIATPAAFAQAAAPTQANPASAPMPSNPAAAPVQPASDAGATERGLSPVKPATGVTPRVRNAATHDTDAAGHTLDPHGKPVGQAPAVPSTVQH